MKLPILGIDPGPEKSGWALLSEDGKTDGGVMPNDDFINFVMLQSPGVSIAIEMIASYGMPVGKEVFDTCVWIGRFMQTRLDFCYDEPILIFRREAKDHICHSPKADDGSMRRALLDMFPRTGGGATPQMGTKKEPGPLYGFSTHAWAALAVAITARDTK